jgi:hypothetical protein
MIRVFAWLGATGISVAPFMIDTVAGKWLAIISLLCLTVQAINLKAYNLVLMNLIGVGGYLYVLCNI